MKYLLVVAAFFLSSFPALAEKDIETIYITGGKEKIRKQPGSAHIISNKDLQEFGHQDVNRVLEKIPGVNIQEEEGFGLRPNIGLRGAHPHRSRKVVLMEDGVLISPAPYAAPAAYYFPMVLKMDAVEVFKGPLAVKYGPNTIGGAVNMVTRSIPHERRGFLDLAVGQYAFRQLQVFHGETKGRWGYSLEAVTTASDGFKKLDGGGDTGFEKNDITLKTKVASDPEASVYQQLLLKLGFANETSHETYLGLTEDDFKASPYRRYAASQRDKFQWQHTQVGLTHLAELNPFTITTDIYRHDFKRNWSKFSGFNSGVNVRDALLDPNGANAGFVRILRGEEDSSAPGGEDKLVIGNNDREYYAQGVQVAVRAPLFQDGRVSHEIETGVRYHEDGIERKHTEDLFLMRGGDLVADGSPRRSTATNFDTSEAVSVYVLDQWTIGQTILTGGIRGEFVKNHHDDRSAANADKTSNEEVYSPGGGVYHQLTPSIGLLFGGHQGYTLVGPGQDDAVKPEESINYEFGVRSAVERFYAEAIGFYSDYKNILGTCTFSSGCGEGSLDKEYNGGKATVLGLETVMGYEWLYDDGLKFPLNFNYTYTQAQFSEETNSENEEWGTGTIKSGDPLPYIPEHKASLKLGAATKGWSTFLATSYHGMMYDQAVKEGREEIPGYYVLDWSYHYFYSDKGEVYAGVDNILDEEYLVSLRPFGARPGKPRLAKVGVKQQF